MFATADLTRSLFATLGSIAIAAACLIAAAGPAMTGLVA